jgi:hypothetical protein
MEKTQMREDKGLDINELEAHSRVQLLPDRIEMHRRRTVKKRIRRQNLNCGGTCFIVNA